MSKIFIGLNHFLYKQIFKRILFLTNSEFIHEGLTAFGELLGTVYFFNFLISKLIKIEDKSLEQNVIGIEFKNPVGLAAGFDYNGKLTKVTSSLGFGFETIGTITNKPYEGNPGPRLGRLVKSRALMVNKGFKNPGIEKILKKLKKSKFSIPVGISIGKTNTTKHMTQNEAVKDITDTFIKAEKSRIKFSYYELNISCPNLYGDISFYPPENLENLLKALANLKLKRPVFIKMPIEKTDKEIIQMLDVITKFQVVGVIFGNLQKDRKDPSLDREELNKYKIGFFSGKPTEKRSNELIKLAYKKYGKKLIIIGCGGIFNGKDAYKKIRLGATLVQFITGMIFEGPQLAAQINLELIGLLKNDGYKNIAEAIGIDNR